MNQYRIILKILNKEFTIHRYKDVFIDNDHTSMRMPYLIRTKDKYKNWVAIGKIWRHYSSNEFSIIIYLATLTEQQKNKLKLIGFNDKDGHLRIQRWGIFV